MQADIKWLDDPRIFKVNEIAPHSDHSFFPNQQESLSNKNSLVMSLDGTWLFNFANNPEQRPKDFYYPKYDVTNWKRVPVPSHVQMYGDDQCQYINIHYPWNGKMNRGFANLQQFKDSFSKGNDNRVASYVKYFDLPKSFENKKVHIVFEGAERSLYLWLNGHFVGYAEDSMAPHEFDLTPYVKSKDNYLAVRLYKYSTASYLEDQDMFRFFGLYRTVKLVALPRIHVQDLYLQPELKHSGGKLTINLQLTGDLLIQHYRVHAAVKGNRIMATAGKVVNKRDISLTIDINEKVRAWSHSDPFLYHLQLVLLDDQNNELEYVEYPFGFRKIAISKDNVLMLNGHRLIINGVNRHEWNSRSGRAITSEDMDRDLQLFEQSAINAVRTCHYMDQDQWYFKCDQHGIYVMAENNLETHGTWTGGHPDLSIPGSQSIWRDAALERAKANFELLKNHPSILFWSLGNESYAGDVFVDLDHYYHERDHSRLVHYEGVSRCPSYRNDISDFESGMYANPDKIKTYLTNHPDKPFISCEYMHSMGNSVGGMRSYVNLVKQYPQDCGGFIWDWIDQALVVNDPVTGKEVCRYGGDFDDRENNGAFSGDGLLFVTRQPKPALQEVSYYYHQLALLNDNNV